MIVHDFPPLGGGAVMRTVKYAKYLPQFGWDPTVLTLVNEAYPPYALDRSLISELPEMVKIVRTKTLQIYENNGETSQQNQLRNRENLTDKLIRAIKHLLSKYIEYQDNAVLWLPYLIPNIIKLSKREDFDIIYSTSPSQWTHFGGYIAQKIYKKPWIMDFRDGWVGNQLFTPKSNMRKIFDRLLEKTYINNASFVISATPDIHHQFIQKYPERSSQFTTIMNGFDPSDFDGMRLNKPMQNCFQLNSFGNLGSIRPLTWFVQAIFELRKEGKITSDSFSVSLYGNTSDENRKIISPVDDLIFLRNQVPHREALSIMINSDALLLVTGVQERESVFTSKVFEYLYSKRPILALASQGDLQTMLAKSGNAIIVQPDSVTEIKNGLIMLMDHFQINQPIEIKMDQYVQSFDRKKLTGNLASIMDSLVIAR
ncbi:MAG: glycosyltransferase [Chloroflexi bacterium]|nr:glycosyltransferase [Chloroflexota bacterium]